ncbi:helix-turn-helix transcriptional regulator [Clostridium guangxiense]|uniref:helix-turn-helix transcriptional regulator n=1 Tax=Clostridium guangxiense TaxID=1662055 RepID=UPI001E296194|nr:helix-turn-helix transcriptional regulator [Clostridium guangxiense]
MHSLHQLIEPNCAFEKVFYKEKFCLHKELYKELPENTIGEKIIKLRLSHDMDREALAKTLHFHVDTIEGWEIHNVMPQPLNIKKLCNFFKVKPKYFHEYYQFYFNNPEGKIKEWMVKNKFTYDKVAETLGISRSGVGSLLNGKLKASFYMYEKLKNL